jgi:type III secretion system FlhB-like substrate exporter
MPRRKRERAVALKYAADLPAPFLLAKASGRGAERLREIAADAGVPVLRDEALAEALYPLEIGDYVPEEYFEIVARVFAFVKRIEET